MDNWKIRQTVDLARGCPSLRVWPDALMVEGDNEAHTWEITVMKDGKLANLAGTTCLVHFLREREGQSEDVICKGSISGNVASVVLKKECYVEGPAVGIFRIVIGSGTLTLSKLMFTISKGPCGIQIDPGSVVGSLEKLLAQMDRMESGTAAANEAAAAANTAAENASSMADKASTAAQSANNAASNAHSKASAAYTAAREAGAAAENANAKADAAGTAAQTANAAADRVDTAIGNANAAADAANTAADRAAAAANTANTAAGNASARAADAEAAALRLSAVEMDVTMLPPSASPTASAMQTDSKTVFSLGIPTSNLACATFEISDGMELMMHSPEGFDDIRFNLTDHGDLEVEIQ